MIKPLQIRDITVPYPVIQAGMGPQVAKSALAAAVARAGGIGCISSVGLGTLEGSLANYIEESSEKLRDEIREARRLAPKGVIGVNIMVALFNYKECVQVCAEENVDLIISGAGLPLKLPEMTAGSSVKLVPIVSSGRSMKIIAKTWHRRYQRLPDAVVIEGPLCGGHMAFSYEQLNDPNSVAIEKILREVKTEIAPFEAEYGREVPMIGAEGIVTCQDVLDMLEKGFDGAQVGTRFICTEESSLDSKSKDVFVKATNDDVMLMQSPLGLPVKVLRTPLSERVARGEKVPFGCPFLCLRACKANKAKFCLADALVSTLFGEVEKGLYMTGSRIGEVNDIIPAEEFFEPFKKLS